MTNIDYTIKYYVEESPKILQNNLINYLELTSSLKKAYLESMATRFVIVASGSSYNASMCIRYQLEEYLGIDVIVVSPFTFVNYTKIKASDFIVVVSQSGCSTNAIDALKYLHNIGKLAIGITGDKNSDFKDYSDLLIDYNCGEEVVGFVTKGMISTCEFLILFGINVSDSNSDLSNLKTAIEAHYNSQEQSLKFIKQHYKKFISMKKIYNISSGDNFGIALESTLKISESCKIISCTYEIEELLHGPYMQLAPDYTLIFYDTNDKSHERITQIYKAAKILTDSCFLITNNSEFKDDPNALVINCKTDKFNWVYYLPFCQLLAYQISNDLGTLKTHPLTHKFKGLLNTKTAHYKTIDDTDQ